QRQCDRHSIVDRMVVNQKQFETRSRIVLLEQPAQALADVDFFIARWDDHRDRGRPTGRARRKWSQEVPLIAGATQQPYHERQPGAGQDKLHGSTTRGVTNRVPSSNPPKAFEFPLTAPRATHILSKSE